MLRGKSCLQLALVATNLSSIRNRLVVANDYGWRALLVNHIEQVTVPLTVVALAGNKLSGRLAFLVLKLRLLDLVSWGLRSVRQAGRRIYRRHI